MRVLSLLVLIIFFAGCKLLKNKTSFEGGGSYLVPLDSISKNDVRIIHLAHSTGVIFPAQYGEKILGNSELTRNCTFFTPDSILIKKVESEIDRQYCAATERHWKSIFSGVKADTYSLPSSSNDTALILKVSAKFCLSWQINQVYYDRQYIGYVSPTGDKIIITQLIDFRDDPRNYKPLFTSVWISGWHGWFYSNIIVVNFNINKNQLTIGWSN